MTLKAHEDKTYRGANIASLTHPVGRGDQRRRGRGRRLPPRLGPRPLPGRDRAARGRGRGRRRPLAGLPLRRAAEARRLVPAEHPARRHAVLGQPAARRGRLPDRAGRPARAPRRRHLGAREARPPTSSSRAAPPPRRSAGRRRAATRPAPSRPRSPAWSAPPTSPGANGDDASAALYTARRRRLAAPRQGLDRSRRPARSATGRYFDPHRRQRRPGRRPPARDEQRRRHVRRARRRRRRLPRPGPARACCRADDPDVIGSLAELDSDDRRSTPRTGSMWYRYNHDGYGEKADGVAVRRHRRRPALAAAHAASAASTSWPRGGRAESFLRDHGSWPPTTAG